MAEIKSNSKKKSGIFIFLTVLIIAVFALLRFGWERETGKDLTTMQINNYESLKNAKVARMWQGRVPDARADEYEKYLSEEGVKKLAGIKGNLGVQLLRVSKDGVTEFTVISYWANREDIKQYAGEDIEKPHHLPKDKDYLLELPKFVKNYDLKTNDWK